VEEIGKVLPAIFRSYMEHLEPRVVEILVPLWSHAVGQAIARQSRPVAFDNGTLKVATSRSSWAVQLRHMSEEIRAGVNRYLGRAVVKRVTVRHSPGIEFPNVIASPGVRSSAGKALASSNRVTSSAWTVPQPLIPEPEIPLPHLRRKPGSSGQDPVLDPEVARILERSFTKYFSRTIPRANWRKDN
jgi:hypothetical protein